MRMTVNEDKFFQLIQSVSGKDISTVRDTLKSILTALILVIYDQHDKDKDLPKEEKLNCVEFAIPYLCTIKIDYSDRYTSKGMVTNINLSALPSESLITEVSNILDDKTLVLEELLEKSMTLKFYNILETSEEELKNSCLG